MVALMVPSKQMEQDQVAKLKAAIKDVYREDVSCLFHSFCADSIQM